MFFLHHPSALVSSTAAPVPFPEPSPSIPTLPSPLPASAVPRADPTYMTKVFGLGGRCAAGGGHRGGAGGGILFQATGLVQPIFRRGMCRADPGCRWVLKTQVMQRCTQSNNQPRVFPALGWKGNGKGAWLQETGDPKVGVTSS